MCPASACGAVLRARAGHLYLSRSSPCVFSRCALRNQLVLVLRSLSSLLTFLYFRLSWRCGRVPCFRPCVCVLCAGLWCFLPLTSASVFLSCPLASLFLPCLGCGAEVVVPRTCFWGPRCSGGCYATRTLGGLSRLAYLSLYSKFSEMRLFLRPWSFTWEKKKHLSKRSREGTRRTLGPKLATRSSAGSGSARTSSEECPEPLQRPRMLPSL